MSCNDGVIKPGKDFDTTVNSSASQFRVTCSGSEVPATITSQGGENYLVEVDGRDVTCPGPLKIETKVNGVWVQLKCFTVSPC